MRLIIWLKRPAPLLGDGFKLPTRRDLDLPLIGGSAVFGIGWGIAGFCPGGALPALGTGSPDVIIFVVAMIAGILIAKRLQTLRANRQSAPV